MYSYRPVCIVLRSRYGSVGYITLHCLHYSTLPYITLQYLHYLTLPYNTYISIHHLTLPYITLHEVTFIYLSILIQTGVKKRASSPHRRKSHRSPSPTIKKRSSSASGKDTSSHSPSRSRRKSSSSRAKSPQPKTKAKSSLAIQGENLSQKQQPSSLVPSKNKPSSVDRPPTRTTSASAISSGGEKSPSSANGKKVLHDHVITSVMIHVYM